jgi:hypothetical protein
MAFLPKVPPHMISRRVVLSSCLVGPSAFAASQGDWFASLYTGEGVELRNDERVFAFFAVLNAAGFDQGPVTRKEPVPKVTYHPVRALVRGKVIGGDPEVKKAADAFFDKNPQALRKYLTYVLHSSPPPFATGAKAKEVADLKGFEQVLAKAWSGWKLEEVMGTVQKDYRAGLKQYLTLVDGPLQKARATLKVPESQESLLVLNLLDAQDQVRAVQGEAAEAYLIVGPSDKPNVEGVIREFARLLVEPQVAKKVGAWAGGASVLREAQLAGATEQTVADFATAVVTTALALKSIDAPDAAYEAAAAKGYFGIKDVAKLFDEGKALEAMVPDALQKVETRRPAKK